MPTRWLIAVCNSNSITPEVEFWWSLHAMAHICVYTCTGGGMEGERKRQLGETQPESTMWWNLGEHPHILKAGWTIRG